MEVLTLSSSMAALFLKEGKVIIPGLGYLELVFPAKSIVLFKVTENSTLFVASEDSIESLIYANVSVPLKERQVVTMSEISVSRPTKNADGSYHISYMMSSVLGKLLNDSMKKGGAEDTEIPDVNANDKKTLLSLLFPKHDIRSNRKTPPNVRNTSKVGDVIIPQEEKKEKWCSDEYCNRCGCDNSNFYYDMAFISERIQYKSSGWNDVTESVESIDLLSFAERKYGNRIFWVYIYEANRV